MALIAPGVIRISVVGESDSQDIINVFDYDCDPNQSGQSREDIAYNLAGDVLNNWTDHVFPALPATYQANEVRWVDLNSADGTTGARNVTDQESWPQVGSVSGPTLPNNCCALLAKNLAGKTRTQRNGSTRLGPVMEAFTLPGAGNRLTTDAVTGYTQALNQFMLDTNEDSEIGVNLSRTMVVVHTVDKVYDGKTPIQSFQARGQVGTIRRRMPGYGS